ncbi:MAG: FAD-dependent oxidoreductase [Phycisphaeraceae bacterium]|nr:FAD-dependent oxidoreductase [Phycisphaeraceae bacterium]
MIGGHFPERVACEVLVIGGGVAGLMTLAQLRAAGVDALLVEHRALGAGQTICAQGIVHGGLKYALDGAVTASARAIRDMPGRWNAMLAGTAAPRLRPASLRSASCVLWRTRTLRGRLGITAARSALRTKAIALSASERPAALASVAGDCYRVDEPVFDPAAVLEDLAAPVRDSVLHALVDAEPGAIHVDDRGVTVGVRAPDGARAARCTTRWLILAAGAGNEALRTAAGLPAGRMQRRPLHMVMIRGPLPPLFGHCIDGMATRATITSSTDRTGQCVWQIGGRVAEAGVGLEPAGVIALARMELASILPGVDLGACAFGAYRVDRAEAARPGGRRPDEAALLREGPCLTLWPTKMALAPRLADDVVRVITQRSAPAGRTGTHGTGAPPAWPTPPIAAPPWEDMTAWNIDRSGAAVST